MFCTNVLSISGFGLPVRGHLLMPPSPNVRHRACIKKRVVFADSKGLSLTSVHVFSMKEEKFHEEPKSLRRLGECTKGPKLRLDLAQPCVDPQAFRQRMRNNAVLLESCCVTERALVGKVRVLNLSYEKDVRVRITFDSWRSQQDVICTFLERRYGEPDTDTFSFHITLPEHLNAQECVEFCVKYLPQGHRQALWDNNNGRNYRLMFS